MKRDRSLFQRAKALLRRRPKDALAELEGPPTPLAVPRGWSTYGRQVLPLSNGLERWDEDLGHFWREPFEAAAAKRQRRCERNIAMAQARPVRP